MAAVGFWDAIAKVLTDEGGPLHSKVITERILDQGLWTSAGKTPAATVASRLYTDINKKGSGSRFIQTGKSTFALNPESTSDHHAGDDTAMPSAGAGTAT